MRFYLFLFLLPFPASAVLPADEARETTLKAGGAIYRACFYCHSLQPGVHLTGPSLADLWGKKAGGVKGFELYSDAMMKSALVWDEATLRKWIHKPGSVLPGTSMIYTGPEDEESVTRLMEFLKIALGPGGYQKVKAQNLADVETADGQLPKDAGKALKKDQVKKILHCGDIYTVTMADGKTARYWESNLVFQVLSGERGPAPQKPVRMPAGSMGDRFAIVFHNAKEIGQLVKSCGQKKAQP